MMSPTGLRGVVWKLESDSTKLLANRELARGERGVC